MSDLDQLQRLVGRLHADLDVLTYYNLLGVMPGATETDIRVAFRERARLLHPDRYYSLEDEALKAQIGAVYKRLSEGHRVLCRAEQRKTYDVLVHQGTLRYSEKAAEAASPPDAQAEAPSGGDGAIRHPQARQFYNYGKDAVKHQDFSQAISYFEQALAVQPDATKIHGKLAEARRLKKLYGP